MPPHFDLQKLDISDLKLAFPHLAANNHVHGVLRFCLASVLANESFLKKNLPSNSSFRDSTILSNGRLHRRLSAILIPASFESTFLHATGIPPHVLVLRALSEINISMQNITPGLVAEITNVLEANGQAAAQVTPATLRQVVIQAVQEAFPHLMESEVAAVAIETPVETSGIVQNGIFQCADGRLAHVPDGFKLHTDLGLLGAWRLWHRGNDDIGVLPYRALLPVDFPPGKEGRVQRHRLSEWKYIMSALIDGLDADDNYDPAALRDPSNDALLMTFFKKAFKMLPKKPKKYHTRPEQWNILTAARETREARNLFKDGPINDPMDLEGDEAPLGAVEQEAEADEGDFGGDGDEEDPPPPPRKRGRPPKLQKKIGEDVGRKGTLGSLVPKGSQRPTKRARTMAVPTPRAATRKEAPHSDEEQ